ncbi:MAG: hypothetical protein CBE50_003140 [Flammeovirgaceae bacterium TMED290]|nr:MAG: hypothetical protein CBE50_003140 [Flammeovirgaceae bacterium TMED290]|tara:strand:- start:6955 stop:7284 length:330 start_codon:yes stop_codon:yes gene_type:complete
MDFVDFVLYFGYLMIIVAAILAIGFPLYIASKNPKSLVNSGVGLISILALFLVSWLISGSEVYTSYAEFGVDESLSKFIGGIIYLVYFLAGIAVMGIIASEFRKVFKNG